MALSHEQVRQLAEARAEIRAMVYVLAYGGMRYGELAAARVGDVDLTRRRIRVSRSVTYVTGDGHVEDDTKTHQDRIVPILTEFLASTLADVIADRGPSEYLFPHHDGGPIPLDWFRWRFEGCFRGAIDGYHSKNIAAYRRITGIGGWRICGNGGEAFGTSVTYDDDECLQSHAAG